MDGASEPIACTLAPAEVPGRLAECASVGARALISATLTDTRAVLRFRDSGDTGDRLSAIVTAEATCCAFLEMDLRRDGDTLS